MKIKINGSWAYGEYSEEQINKIHEEMRKPKDKRKYILGIEFSKVDEVEVQEWAII